MKKHISPKNNLKNLNLIINSDTYKLAHEDIGLLSRNEMRGVRMLLEITKPDLILEENLNKECIDYPNQEDCLVCCN